MKFQIPRILVFIFGVFMIFQRFVPHESSEWIYEYLLDWILVIGVFALAPGWWSLYRVAADKIKNRKENWIYSYLTLCGLVTMVLFGFTTRQRAGQEGEVSAYVPDNAGDWGLYFLFIISVNLILIFLTEATASRKYKGLLLALAGVSLISSIAIGMADTAWGFYFESAVGLQNTMFVRFFDYIIIPVSATMFSLLAFFIASAAYRAFRARSLLASLLLFAALFVMLRFFPYFGDFAHAFFSKSANWLMNVPNLAAQRAIVIGVGLGIVATALKVILGIERGYMGKG
jgi:hypothetical protein